MSYPKQLIVGKEGTISSMAFYQLLELQGVKLGFEDRRLLEKQSRDKPGSKNVVYKQALQWIQPNYELEDPVRSTWVFRKAGDDAGFDTRSRASHLSRGSFASSISPKK